MEVGHRHFGGGDQVVFPIRNLEKIFLEFGKLARALHGLAVDHERRQDFGAALLMMEIQIEAHERALKAGGPAPRHGETAAGELGSALEVEAAVVVAQIPVVLHFEIKLARRTPAVHFHIVVLVHAVGNGGVRDIRHGKHPVREIGLHRFGGAVQRADAGRKIGKAGDEGFGVFPVALQAGHFGGGAVALGFEGFHLSEQLAALVVEFFKSTHVQGRMALRKSGGHHFGIFLQQFEIQHFSAPCLPVWREKPPDRARRPGIGNKTHQKIRRAPFSAAICRAGRLSAPPF